MHYSSLVSWSLARRGANIVHPKLLYKQHRALTVATSMQTVKKVAERLTGQGANGFHQTDVADLRGRVRDSNG